MFLIEIIVDKIVIETKDFSSHLYWDKSYNENLLPGLLHLSLCHPT